MPGEVEIVDRRFADFVLGNASLERLATGMRWAEGPVYVADAGHLLVSDIPNDRILRWVEGAEMSVFRQPSNFANGHTRDRSGRLVSCEHGTRRVTRTEMDGSVTVLADSYRGRRLNSPNDVVVKSDGSVWFTDPTYGILSDYEGHKAPSELDGCYVFRFDPQTGELDVVADDMVKPNGLAFSTDETVLYVADSARTHDPGGPHHLCAYEVRDGRELHAPRVVGDVSPGVPDGLAVDDEDFLWCSAGDGVHCYAPDGTLLGRIRVPETVANCTFGDPKRNRLFIAATTSLYAIYLNRRGPQFP
ncbi:SMP-30/gluconolactonase/LRE family protein [Actinobacteria bacterium YIM 96077]|uniref:SMP-30/gluconolactonase/LRE family protein n=1 Tax=Phytoactinopolyspora halophila TaxID=1981511 RepID=A0A329QXB6_9ACTN|nr:SMP-30/gluconolactonase/LRE family protein [Phytoactinopolyspora halophila]AYY12858.1 SMP-30/gluconolactonase/LRE family protein [Actinobacteria bacterium YIM 96077]RAW16349.1 SMP-30/gluconolactonase/LRE family protein [Phytoactinopolyspora halophila]